VVEHLARGVLDEPAQPTFEHGRYQQPEGCGRSGLVVARVVRAAKVHLRRRARAKAYQGEAAVAFALLRLAAVIVGQVLSGDGHHEPAHLDGAFAVGARHGGVADAALIHLRDLAAAVGQVHRRHRAANGGMIGTVTNPLSVSVPVRAIRPTKTSAKFAHVHGAAMAAFATGALLRDSPNNMEVFAAYLMEARRRKRHDRKRHFSHASGGARPE
jgi:hypothetical protein